MTLIKYVLWFVYTDSSAEVKSVIREGWRQRVIKAAPSGACLRSH